MTPKTSFEPSKRDAEAAEWPEEFVRTLGAWPDEIERPASSPQRDPFANDGEDQE